MHELETHSLRCMLYIKVNDFFTCNKCQIFTYSYRCLQFVFNKSLQKDVRY